MKKFHNDFDQEIIVCKGCEEFVNEGIIDDREKYHSGRKCREIVSCAVCGEWSDGGEA